MGSPQRLMGILAWIAAATFSAGELSVSSIRPPGQPAWIVGARTRRAGGGSNLRSSPPKQPQRHSEDRAEGDCYQQRHRQAEGNVGPLRPRHESGFQERGDTLQSGNGAFAIRPHEGIAIPGGSPRSTAASRCRCCHFWKCRVCGRRRHGKFRCGSDLRFLACRWGRLRCKGTLTEGTRGQLRRTPGRATTRACKCLQHPMVRTCEQR